MVVVTVQGAPGLDVTCHQHHVYAYLSYLTSKLVNNHMLNSQFLKLWCISCSAITIYPSSSPPSSSLIPNMCHSVVTLPNGRSAPSSVAAASYRDRGSRTRAHSAA
jgi:ribosomal protein S27E